MSMKLRALNQNSKVPYDRAQVLGRRAKKTFEDGRTQQAFKNETDINRIMARAQKTGTISHLNQHRAQYADFADYDFFEHQRKLTLGRELMDSTPSEIRKEFNNDPQKFFAYVNDPANADRLEELLPALAEPGRQILDVSGKTPPETSLDVASESETSERTTADASPASSPESPEEG